MRSPGRAGERVAADAEVELGEGVEGVVAEGGPAVALGEREEQVGQVGRVGPVGRVERPGRSRSSSLRALMWRAIFSSLFMARSSTCIRCSNRLR
ncbi:hypothetical protein [Sorangium sp. So ce362]|uniref:hypothetical protein n=1 Tax=Sorangium sp. So ce362 TaxID=3133303 RepID=UPI003F5F147F